MFPLETERRYFWCIIFVIVAFWADISSCVNITANKSIQGFVNISKVHRQEEDLILYNTDICEPWKIKMVCSDFFNCWLQSKLEGSKNSLTAQNQLRRSNPSLEALNLSLRAQISVGILNRQMSYVRQKKSWYVVILTIVGCYQILKRIPWGSNPILFSTNSHKMKQKNMKRENDLKWFKLM